MTFGPLPNTKDEVTTIRELYGKLFEIKSDDPRALMEREADEASFRELAPRYRHLHLATHGFFTGAEYTSAFAAGKPKEKYGLSTERDAPVTGYDPGLLSGLALAGANRVATSEADDGILTAQEIGVMNLNDVDTVVLSACDTGLGATAGGEGLLGVQRAFQVAGARTTVASYWKVDDLVTRLLMERFYRNLWDKDMTRLDALREAQLFILNNPDKLRGATVVETEDSAKLRTSPRLWAAFGLSGDWR
jgi:CHAT domain-containing protein